MNIKYTLATGLLGATLGLGALAMPANADVDVDIRFGVPHYNYQVRRDYVFRNGYGWYLPADRFDNRFGRLSCGEARQIVREHGYRKVATRECQGRTYTFRATRNGRTVLVYINSSTGRIWRA